MAKKQNKKTKPKVLVIDGKIYKVGAKTDKQKKAKGFKVDQNNLGQVIKKTADGLKKISKNKIGGNSGKKRNDVYYDREFQLFRFWRSLPPMLLGKSKEQLINMGFDDEEALDLLQIRTMKAFAEKFGIDEDTVYLWRKRMIDDGEPYGDWKIWAKRLTRNVQTALYAGAVKEKDAPRIKLWHQLTEGWKDSSSVDHSGNITFTSILDEVENKK